MILVVEVIDYAGATAFSFAGTLPTDFAKTTGIRNDVAEQKIYANEIFKF